MAIALDPATLPKLDVLSLAQSGMIVRAERDTPEGGIPAFLTRKGWDELIHHHRLTPQEDGAVKAEEEPLEQTAQRLLPALERIAARLLSEAAQGAQSQKNEQASLFTLETDLFPSSPQTRILLVADKTHPVICALIGTPEHLTQLLTQTRTESGAA